VPASTTAGLLARDRPPLPEKQHFSIPGRPKASTKETLMLSREVLIKVGSTS